MPRLPKGMREIPCRSFPAGGKDEALFRELFSRRKGVFLGDLHSRFNIREYLISKMPFLAQECGVKTLFTECSLHTNFDLYHRYAQATSQREVAAIEAEIWNDLKHIDPYVVDGKREMTFMVLQKARRAGIRIVPINLMHAYKSTTLEDQKKERLDIADPFWAALIQKYTHNDPSKYLVWVGAAHVNLAKKLRIPKILFLDYRDRRCDSDVKVVKPSKTTLGNQNLQAFYDAVFYLSESPFQTSEDVELIYPNHRSLRLPDRLIQSLYNQGCSLEIQIGPRKCLKRGRECYKGHPIIQSTLYAPTELLKYIYDVFISNKLLKKEFSIYGDERFPFELSDNKLTVLCPHLGLFAHVKHLLENVLA